MQSPHKDAAKAGTYASPILRVPRPPSFLLHPAMPE
jgi:hypothetical protein